MKTFLSTVGAILFSLLLSAQAYRGNTIKQTPEEKLNELYCTGMFKSTEGTILDVASNISSKSYFNILDWLQGRVAGLQIYFTRNGTAFPVIRGNIPAIYVDEVLVTANYLNFINVNDIAMVKVIKTPFLGGFNGGGGAIAIYTLKEEETDGE